MLKTYLRAWTIALAMLAGAQSRSYGTELSDLKQTDGFYEINSIDEFKAFAQAVKDGQVKINGRLMADLDGFNEDCMVPTYEGHFDGQYHTITLNINAADEQGIAIFKFLQNGAVIENLGARGTVKASNKLAASFVGDMYESTLRNCWSTVDITTTCVGDATSGGMIGRIKTPSVVENCIFAGSLVGMEAFKCGGLVGYMSKPGVQVTNCVVMGRYQLADNDNNTFNRKPDNAVYTNCYYLNTSCFASVSDKCTEITAEQVASGELCFLLNGDQTALAYYQSLNEDAFPMPNPSHARVYSTAGVSCDGTITGAAGYTNDPEQAGKRQDHEFVHGFCANCQTLQPEYLTPGEDGWYTVADEHAMAWLAASINKGKTPSQANARLTADIDMSSYTSGDYMFGTGNMTYKGIFDGQLHTVNINYEDLENEYVALFRRIEGATIKNLNVTGTLTTRRKFAGGVVGESSNVQSTIEKVTCFVDIQSQVEGDGTHGGIIAIPNSNVTLKDVIFGGSIHGPQTTHCGGMVGWASTKVTFNNCLMIGEMACNNEGCATFSRNSGSNAYANCYYGGPALSREDNGKAVQLSEEDITGGKAAFLLNGSQFSHPVWYQTVGQDDVPTLDSTHGVVYCVNDMCGCVVDGDVTELRQALTNSGAEYVADLVAQKSLKEAYVAQAQKAGEQTTLAEIAAAFDELMKVKAQLDTSVAAYQTYINKVEETRAYLEAHPELQGPQCDALLDYLTNDAAPSDENPFGEYSYILEQETCSKADLESEMKRIDAWLLRVIAANATAGSEVTNLLTNADFSENYEGWSGKGGSTPNTAGPMPAGFCYSGTMNRYQTLTGVKNGVYELVMNASFFTERSLDNALNTNYAATLYAGENEVPVMAVCEDALSATDARDGENCWIQDLNTLPYDFRIQLELNGPDYYIPSHEMGAAYAFNGGRYVNRILVNVTDGKLTLGLRVDDNGVNSNLTCFANARLYYLGEVSEAGEGIASVLEGQMARANTILNNYEVITDGNYAKAPNFSQTLRENLRSLLAEAATATDNAVRYVLIEKFSKAFADIFEGKKAYRMMYDLTSRLDPLSYYLDADSYTAYYTQLKQIEEAYEAGSYTTEQAQKAIETMNASYGYLIPEKKDGFYELNSVVHWVYFTTQVNKGESTAKARLMKDIDLSEVEIVPLNLFSGELDGQGHTLTINMKATDSDGYAPILESRGVYVHDLNITGTIDGGGRRKITSLISNNKEKPFVLERVYSSVTLKSNYSGDSSISGFCADNRDVTGTSVIRDCAFVGTVNAPQAMNTGGLVGWNKSPLEVQNTMVATIYDASPVNSSTLVRQSSSELTKFTNCYYLVPVATLQGTALTQEQLESGEAAYLLQAERSEQVWYQTIGEDKLPVLDPTHGVVIKKDGAYENATGIEMVQDTRNGVNANDAIYDLTGRRMPSGTLPRGLYIVKGRKTYVR